MSIPRHRKIKSAYYRQRAQHQRFTYTVLLDGRNWRSFMVLAGLFFRTVPVIALALSNKKGDDDLYKSCGRCGKIHPANYKCNAFRVYNGGMERQQRNTGAWHKKSIEIRTKACFLCEVCKDQGRFTCDALEVHHIKKLKDDPDGLLDDANLICLCVQHHKMADKGQLDADYLKGLALLREGGEF